MADATPLSLDRWELRMKAPSPEYFKRRRPYAFVPVSGDGDVRFTLLSR